MATTLQAKLDLDASGFLTALNNAIERGKQAVAQAIPKVKVDVDGGGAESGVKKTSGLLGGLTDKVKEVGSSVSGLGGIFHTAIGIVGAEAVLGMVSGIGAIGKAMIDSNAEFETFTTQIATLTGSTTVAKNILKELADFGASTPFELPEIAKAEKTLLGFGLTGQKAIEMTGRNSSQLRTVAGDIAAGTGVAFEEVALLLGKFSSGATGEAISRLQELGVATREQMKAMGVEFSKSGELVSPLPKAMKAALDIANEKFGGGMKALSATFGGQMSTLTDNFGALMRDLGAPLFDVAKNVLGTINGFLSGPIFGKIKEVVGNVFGSAINIVVKIVGGIIDYLGLLFGKIGDFFGFLSPFISGLFEALGGLQGFIMRMFAPLIALFGGLVVVSSVLYEAWKALTAPIIELGKAAFGYLIETAKSLKDSVVGAFNYISGAVSSFFASVSSAGKGIFSFIAEPIIAAFGWVQTTLTNAIKWIKDFIGQTAVGKAVFDAFGKAVSTISDIFDAVFSKGLSSFSNFVGGVSAIAGNLGKIITGQMSIGEAFKQGVDEADKAAKDAQFAEELEKKVKALGGALQSVTNIPVEQEGVKTLQKQIEDFSSGSVTALEKASISEAIARQVPGAVQGIKKIADENGNLVSVFDINIEKVKEYAATQDLVLKADFSGAQGKIRDGFQAQIQSLDQAQTKLKTYTAEISSNAKKIQELQQQAAKDPTNQAVQDQLKALVDKQDELKNNYKETKRTIDDTNEALRGTVQQSLQAGAVGKEEFSKLAQSIGRSKAEADGLVAALAKPVVPKIDVSKLAEQYDQFINSLKGVTEKNLGALGGIELQRKKTKDEIEGLNKDLKKANTEAQREALRDQLAMREKYLENLKEQEKKSQDDIKKSSKDFAKEQVAVKNREEKLDYSKNLDSRKKQAAEDLKLREEQLKQERTKINERLALERQELEDKLTLEKSRLELDKKYGLLSNAEAANYNTRVKQFEEKAANERRALAVKQAIDESEAKRKAREATLKSEMDTEQKMLEFLVALDERATAERAKKRLNLMTAQNKLALEGFIDQMPQYQKILDTVKLQLDDSKVIDEKAFTEKIAQVREALKKALNDKKFENPIFAGLDVGELKKQAALFQQIEAASQAKTAKAQRDYDNEIALARARGVENIARREYEIKIAQANITRQKELDLAGESAADKAQAELKYEGELIDARRDLRLAGIANVALRETETALAAAEKQYLMEIAGLAKSGEEKLKIIRDYAEKKAALEADKTASASVSPGGGDGAAERELANEKALQERRLEIARQYAAKRQEIELKAARAAAPTFDAILTAMENVAANLDAKRFDYDSEQKKLKSKLREDLATAGNDSKARIEIQKKYQADSLSLDRRYKGLKNALATIQDGTAEAMDAVSKKNKAAFSDSVKGVKSFSDVSGKAWESLATSAGASMASVLASGQSFTKALGKAAFDGLNSLIPVIVAQVFGQSVGTLGPILGPIVGATITAAFYGLVAAARSSLGFRKGGYTGDGRDDAEAGVVHKREFVSTAETTRRERTLLEYIHKGGSSERYFQDVYLPRVLSLNAITTADKSGHPVMAALEKLSEKVTTITERVTQQIRSVTRELTRAGGVGAAAQTRLTVAPLMPRVTIGMSATGQNDVVRAIERVEGRVASLERTLRRVPDKINSVHRIELEARTDKAGIVKSWEKTKRRRALG